MGLIYEYILFLYINFYRLIRFIGLLLRVFNYFSPLHHQSSLYQADIYQIGLHNKIKYAAHEIPRILFIKRLTEIATSPVEVPPGFERGFVC